MPYTFHLLPFALGCIQLVLHRFLGYVQAAGNFPGGKIISIMEKKYFAGAVYPLLGRGAYIFQSGQHQRYVGTDLHRDQLSGR